MFCCCRAFYKNFSDSSELLHLYLGRRRLAVPSHGALPPRFGQRLFAALDTGDATGVETVLKEVSSAQHRTTLVNNLVHRGRSLLQHAGRTGDVGICRLLLQFGAAPDVDPDRPLAASQPTNRTVGGVDPPGGGTPLHYAAASLAAAPAAARLPIATTTPGNGTPYCVSDCLFATVALLLEAGADPCRENAEGLTPIDLLLGEQQQQQHPLHSAGRREGARGAVPATSSAATGGAGCLSGLLAALRGRRPRPWGGAHRAALRRMVEAGAVASCVAMLQVAPFGSPENWQPVWVAVIPRRSRWSAGRSGAGAGVGAARLRGGGGGGRMDSDGDAATPRELLCFTLDGHGPEQMMGAGRLLVRLPLLGCVVERAEDCACVLFPALGADGGSGGIGGGGEACPNRDCLQPWPRRPPSTTAATGGAAVAAGGSRWALCLRPVVSAGALLDAQAAARQGDLDAVLAACGRNTTPAPAAAAQPPPRLAVPPLPVASRVVAPPAKEVQQPAMLTQRGLASVAQGEVRGERSCEQVTAGAVPDNERGTECGEGRPGRDRKGHGGVVVGASGGYEEPPVCVARHGSVPGDARGVAARRCSEVAGSVSEAVGPAEPLPRVTAAEGGYDDAAAMVGAEYGQGRAGSGGMASAQGQTEVGRRSARGGSDRPPAGVRSADEGVGKGGRELDPGTVTEGVGSAIGANGVTGVGSGAAPAEDPAPGVHGGGTGGTSASGNGGGACVICLAAPPVVGFRHGVSVHCCACYACAQQLLPPAPGPAAPPPAAALLCPLCRQSVEEVLLVFTP